MFASTPSLRAMLPLTDDQMRLLYADASNRLSVNNGPRLPSLDGAPSRTALLAGIGSIVTGLILTCASMMPSFLILCLLGMVILVLEGREGVLLDSPFAVKHVAEEHRYQVRRRISLLELSIQHDIRMLMVQVEAMSTMDTATLLSDLRQQLADLQRTREEYEADMTRLLMAVEMASLGETLAKAQQAYDRVRMDLAETRDCRLTLADSVSGTAPQLEELERVYRRASHARRAAAGEMLSS
jgi:hypothetical protein